MRKVPTIILSITYKGVKFIDAANKVRHHMHILSCYIWTQNQRNVALKCFFLSCIKFLPWIPVPIL